MYLHSCRIRNFRRLRDVRIDFQDDISIFVGPNNSGKTSAAHALQMFLTEQHRHFAIHDFHCESWREFNAAGESKTAGNPLPTISLDLWFEIDKEDLHRVLPLLPSLLWKGSKVGLRIVYAPRNDADLLEHYAEEKASAASKEAGDKRDRGESKDESAAKESVEVQTWPTSLTDYLSKREVLHREYQLQYYVLDQDWFTEGLEEKKGFIPQSLQTPGERGAARIVESIIKVSCLNAQRHLSDNESGRDENLSRRFSRFYQRSCDQCVSSPSALGALVESESHMNEHLAQVFNSTLEKLKKLGYPRLDNPRLLIKTDLDPEAILKGSSGTHVHYELGGTPERGDPATLPDKYNGLGFKNLIYMVIEIIDLHEEWSRTKEERPPLHLVLIEEPEAHLHVQIQQVFINKVLDLLTPNEPGYHSQVVVTTHSPHILFERGFAPVRYFRRRGSGREQISEVLNLSIVDSVAEAGDHPFLERYMKLTHCDLFFADAAILVEGSVEKTLMPLMIEHDATAKGLQSAYVSVLEIGGAFAHKFRKLLQFIGIPTLIITDLDSVRPPAHPPAGNGGEVDDESEDATGVTCSPLEKGAITANMMLRDWLPGKATISELIKATPEQRTTAPTDDSPSGIRVAYQKPFPLSEGGENAECLGRTFEEAFGIENFAFCQDPRHKTLGLKSKGTTLSEKVEAMCRRVRNGTLRKTDFALGLIRENAEDWVVPSYIQEGLVWLMKESAKPIPLPPQKASPEK